MNTTDLTKCVKKSFKSIQSIYFLICILLVCIEYAYSDKEEIDPIET